MKLGNAEINADFLVFILHQLFVRGFLLNQNLTLILFVLELQHDTLTLFFLDSFQKLVVRCLSSLTRRSPLAIYCYYFRLSNHN